MGATILARCGAHSERVVSHIVTQDYASLALGGSGTFGVSQMSRPRFRIPRPVPLESARRRAPGGVTGEANGEFFPSQNAQCMLHSAMFTTSGRVPV